MVSQKWTFRLDRIIDQLYYIECKVVLREHKLEPIKPITIPKSWESVNLAFEGYNIVMVNQRSRYPVVEEVNFKWSKETSAKLKEIFSIYGTPRKIQTHIGLPFQAREFARGEGFHHHKLKMLHPQVNGKGDVNKKNQNRLLTCKEKTKWSEELIH